MYRPSIIPPTYYPMLAYRRMLQLGTELHGIALRFYQDIAKAAEKR